jgi:hypothetical protein
MCFPGEKSLSSISFESDSRLRLIESNVFSCGCHESIVIPRSVKIHSEASFDNNYALSSVSFESNSVLRRIESNIFRNCDLKSIVIPRNIEVIEDLCFKD